jgi:hypothetical protein
MIGNEDKSDDAQISYCKCCSRRIENVRIKLNCDLTELSFLGSGFPLFFTYTKFCLIFLIILFGVSGIFNAVTNGTVGIIILIIINIITTTKK